MEEARRHFITVVSGLPRSGTSMMMRALEAGGLPIITDNVRTADDDNPNGYYEYEAVKHVREDASWLVDAHGKAVKMVYLLLYELPNDHVYRVIFMQREIEEVIASQDAMLRRQGRQADVGEGAQIVSLFQAQLKKLTAWAHAQEHLSMITVDYNALLRAPTEAMREVDRFLGGGLDTAAMAAVVDPALYRQRAPSSRPPPG
jgi:hypothetical protein